jgi:integrase/recombinase XerD
LTGSIQGSMVRSVKVEMVDGSITRTVVGHDGLPIEHIEIFLNYLRTIRSSPNTVTAYASHLALLFRWLDIRGVPWIAIDFDGLCMFVQDLQDGTVPALTPSGHFRPIAARSRSTTEAVLAAVCSFFEYWRLEGVGPQDLRLYRDARSSKSSRFSFLAHVEQRRVRQERRIKVRGPKAPLPKVIDFESDFQRLIGASSTARDRALLCALYDGGLRIGQVLGLRHEDLDLAGHRISVVRRENNTNGAMSKQRTPFSVAMPGRFFTYYAESLIQEQSPLGIESDYVFVNLNGARVGRPMTYSNAIQIVESIGSRAGVPLTPHMLRHTHATDLAKRHWTAAQIAKRLGHSSATSAEIYTHLGVDDITERYRQTFGGGQ